MLHYAIHVITPRVTCWVLICDILGLGLLEESFYAHLKLELWPLGIQAGRDRLRQNHAQLSHLVVRTADVILNTRE
jgi:hypothetical protein